MKTTEGNGVVEQSVTEEDVRLLIERKDEIEEQIKAYYDMLEDQGDVGMHGPLVDVEGFPRADVDLYIVRTARHNISCLQNDHKTVMVEIENALHKLHAKVRVNNKQGEAMALVESTEQAVSLPSPFARVDTIIQGSPAFQSGLQIGDEVLEFGSVNTRNFKNLHDIASVVQHSEGVQPSTSSKITSQSTRTMRLVKCNFQAKQLFVAQKY
ncbi:26S proteasome non-ATPase regulatory subunit 9-like isoform X2 [Myxocyprinus asiaticus]|uniref:26S proteasome non-ATPase regulatory subunit 9-like isoform X2 n=1 Tax=Myxocyprinus asiaticus TaxID=70543 RepID=UPI002223D4A0|nr:26S proteasome non-ATPase regulatory subunit 9-like isoform X2 [Myxocyprinus asiaticus]